MKNITLSADEALLEKARAKASAEQTTLNQLFRDWLAHYTQQQRLSEDRVREFLKQYSHFRIGKMPTRDELHER